MEEKRRKNKRAMPNKKREQTALMEDRKIQVRVLMDRGIFNRSKICRALGWKPHALKSLFTIDRDFFAEFKLNRSSIMENATDNLRDVVEDFDHPKNYDASKFMVTNFKSEFDEELESKTEDDISISSGAGMDSGITIVFGKPKGDKEEDDE